MGEAAFSPLERGGISYTILPPQNGWSFAVVCEVLRRFTALPLLSSTLTWVGEDALVPLFRDSKFLFHGCVDLS